MKTMVRLNRFLSFPTNPINFFIFILGRHTVLDHYTFKWTEGRMALALGLGYSDLLF